MLANEFHPCITHSKCKEENNIFQHIFIAIRVNLQYKYKWLPTCLLLTHPTASSRLLIGCSAETCLNIQSNKDQRWKMSTIKTTIILPSNLNFFIHKMIEIPVSRSLVVSAGCVCMSVAPAQCSQVSCERWLYNWLGTDLYRNAPAPGHISTTLYSSLLLPPAPLLLPPALSRQRHSPVQTPHWASGLNEICPDFSFTFHGLMAGM